MAESEYSIAIIGMEGRFPKANNVENFWENLKMQEIVLTEMKV